MTNIENRAGKLVAIAGGDGAGKGTQAQLLLNFLRENDIPSELIRFPQYLDNRLGEKCGRYQNDEFGEVHPMFAGYPYSLDRLAAKPKIEGWLNEGKIVIADRYVESNIAYMVAKAEEKDEEKVLEWYLWLEYEFLQIPREDLVLLLRVDPTMSWANVSLKGPREYIASGEADKNEKDFELQDRVATTYLKLSHRLPNWRLIQCMNEYGALKSKETIHRMVLENAYKAGIIPERK